MTNDDIERLEAELSDTVFQLVKKGYTLQELDEFMDSRKKLARSMINAMTEKEREELALQQAARYNEKMEKRRQEVWESQTRI